MGSTNAQVQAMKPPSTRHKAGEPAPARGRRIMLVDDHAILRTGLRSLIELESDLQVVAEAGGTDEAIAMLPAAMPELVITDLAMPGRGGLELVEELGRQFPAIRALILSAYNNEEYIRAALTRGAHGFVLKDSSREELLQGIRAVLRGEWFLSPAVSSHVVARFLSGPDEVPSNPSYELVTRREHEVLTRIAGGLSNRKIADDLGLSVTTVRKHRQNLMQKLSLHNAASITAYAYRNGLVAEKSGT